MRFLAAAACSLLITEAAALSPQPAARLEDRLRDYIERFEQEASALVAEEDYVQKLVRYQGMSAVNQDRRVRSDYVLVKPADNEPWLGYRDIFEVDGHAVRDREERLVSVLAATTPDSRERAMAMVREGSRYNLGPERTINVPTLPLQLLARANVMRFNLRAPRNWQRQREVEIPFQESVRPTLVRTPEGASVETRGMIRVRVSDGAILEARLDFKFSSPSQRDRDANLHVRFAEVPGITVPVPIRMSESVPVYPSGEATGIAIYSKYRRFQTTARIR